MPKPHIPNTVPPLKGRELEYLQEVISARHFRGDGAFTKRCHTWLQDQLKTPKVLLTHSCTAALEMCALLADLQPGDEVILPSYTFSSTANAIALRNAVPIFVDIRPDTMNIDEKLIEAAITPKTRAIFVVHYAGVGCEMDAIMEIARRHKLLVFEDAAQALMATYKGKALGTIAELGALSFHDTKNVVSGEGGALLINDPSFNDRAEIIREKGTNRNQFFRGQVDKYTWVDVGSSYLPSEFISAVLLAQLEFAQEITNERVKIWNFYHEAFSELESRELARRPVVPPHCKHNGHIYYLVHRSFEERTRYLAHMKAEGISALFHYLPLHSAPAGRKFGRTHGSLAVTDSISDQLARLPLYSGLSMSEASRVVESVFAFYKK